MMAEEVDYLAFGPASVVSIGLSEKRAMASMRRFQKSDVRIVEDFGARFGNQPDERIVQGVDD